MNEKISNIEGVIQKKQLGGELIEGKTPELDPRMAPFKKCSNLFKNDPERNNNPKYSIQNLENLFDKAKINPEENTKFLSIIENISEEELKNCFIKTSFERACTKNGFITEFIDTYNVYNIKNDVVQQKTKEEKQQENVNEKLNKLRAELNNIKDKIHDKEALKIIDNNSEPSSEQFKTAARTILSELKDLAKKTGDFKDYKILAEKFHSIGAISDAEFIKTTREIQELENKLSESGKLTDKPIDTAGKAIETDLKKQDYERFGDVYVKHGEKTNEIIEINEKNGKSTKKIISEITGYSHEIRIDLNVNGEQNIASQEIFQVESDIQSLNDKLGQVDKFSKNFMDIKQGLSKNPNDTELKTKIDNYRKAFGVDKNISNEDFIDIKIRDFMEKRAYFEEKQKQMETKKISIKKTISNNPNTKENGSMQAEKNIRKVINFVDMKRLDAFELTNINKIFEVCGDLAGNMGMSFDYEKNFSFEAESFMNKRLALVVGEGIYSPVEPFGLLPGKSTEDIKVRLKEKGLCVDINNSKIDSIKLEKAIRNTLNI